MSTTVSRARIFAAFLAIILPIWGLLHAILLWRVWSIPFVARLVPRWALCTGIGLLGLSYIAARLLERTFLKAIAPPLEIVGATWMGVILLLLTCLLVADVVTGFGWIFPRIAPTVRGWALIAGAVLSVVALVQGLRPPTVTNVDVRLPGLPAEREGTVLAFASDFHLGTMAGNGWLRARAAQIDALRADIVVLGGDIFEGGRARERVDLPALRQFKAPLGVFAVTGNHDGMGLGPGEGNPLDTVGFRMLRDEWVEVAPGLVLAGVNDGGFQPSPSPRSDRVARALAGRPPGAATVFISHAPAGAETAARLGAGLMLAGHTHAGQIWPFSLIVRRVIPLFVGRYDVGGMPVIVCRGTGTFGPRMRLWKRSEILRVTLRAAPARL